MTPAKNCPYGADDCPKIEDIEKRAENHEKDISEIKKILYILIGMVAVNWGISLW